MTSDEELISNWSSHVCTSDIDTHEIGFTAAVEKIGAYRKVGIFQCFAEFAVGNSVTSQFGRIGLHHERLGIAADRVDPCHTAHGLQLRADDPGLDGPQLSGFGHLIGAPLSLRRKIAADEHTSELQSLMRISYAVF